MESEKKEAQKQVVNINSAKFKVTATRTTVAVSVDHPKSLDMHLVDMEESIPDGISIIHDNETKTTFVGQFVHTNEVKELDEFKDFVANVARVYLSAAIAFDSYKDTRNVLCNTLKSIDLDMAAVVYKPEQK